METNNNKHVPITISKEFKTFLDDYKAQLEEYMWGVSCLSYYEVSQILVKKIQGTKVLRDAFLKPLPEDE